MHHHLRERFQAESRPQLYQRLVETHRPLVYSVCRRYLRDPADVDDAVQETFLKLSAGIDCIHGHVSGWLTSVAYTTCLHLIRTSTREQRRRQMVGHMGPARLENRLLHEAVGQRLNEALLQLDEFSRRLIIQRFFDKLPLRAIAGQSNASVPTVSRRVHQALTDLAAVLRDMGIESVDDLTLAEHFGDPNHLPEGGGRWRARPALRSRLAHPGARALRAGDKGKLTLPAGLVAADPCRCPSWGIAAP